MSASHQITLDATRDSLWLGPTARAEDLILKAKARAWQLLRSGQSGDVKLVTVDGSLVAHLSRIEGTDDVHVVDEHAGTSVVLDVPIKRAA